MTQPTWDLLSLELFARHIYARKLSVNNQAHGDQTARTMGASRKPPCWRQQLGEEQPSEPATTQPLPQGSSYRARCPISILPLTDRQQTGWPQQVQTWPAAQKAASIELHYYRTTGCIGSRSEKPSKQHDARLRSAWRQAKGRAAVGTECCRTKGSVASPHESSNYRKHQRTPALKAEMHGLRMVAACARA